MSRFNKYSKYHNAIVNVHKKDRWIHDLKVGSNLRPSCNHISASCDYLAFVQDSTSVGALAILPVNSCGRFPEFPKIAGHSAQVTDFGFSPFNSRLLATGSEDCMVKLWNIPEELDNCLRLTEPVITLGPFKARIENLLFHPSADNVLAVSSKDIVEIFDIKRQSKCYELNGHENIIESISWHGNGQLLSTISRKGSEKNVKIFDPRSSNTCVSDVDYHNGQKHSCTLFLSDTNFLLTAGFNKMREAELILWDCNNFSKPLSRQSLGTTSSGSPSVLYDGDSKMLFATLKSESTISFFDCAGSLVPGQQAYRGSHVTKGVAMVPKYKMDVMSCEIVRLLQLTQNAIIPISFHVQRKSYTDFHGDLYPDTPGGVPSMTAEEWSQGLNTKLDSISLDPKKRQPKILNDKKNLNAKKSEDKKTCSEDKKTCSEDSVQSALCASETESKVSSKVSSTKNIVRSSKFRHIEGKYRHKSSFISKIPRLSSTVPGDSNAFQANPDRVAAVLSSSGGQLGVFELKNTGRLDGNAVPTLQNGSAVLDFVFDPFNRNKIVVACEDAKLRLWTIPANGLSETLTEPNYLSGHRDKANILQFHPQAKSLLASAGYDCQVILWNLDSLSIALTLNRLPEPLFCMAWSPNGMLLATLAKNHILYIFEPRSNLSPICQMRGPEGNRGARIVWLEEFVVAVSGFDKSSMRTISLFNTKTSSRLSEIQITMSPSTLIPYFDRDTSLLLLTGKGDNSIFTFEYVKSDLPYLFAVSPFQCGSHQGVAYLPKRSCDVTKVEIAVGLRLTASSVEQFAFHVPRTRLNYFQDDIYPDTLCTEDAPLSVHQWLQGENKLQKTYSLKPSNMKPLSDAPKEAPAAKKFTSYNSEYKSDQQKKEELLSAMIDKMGDKDDDPLPQKNMDGADSDEWSDD